MLLKNQNIKTDRRWRTKKSSNSWTIIHSTSVNRTIVLRIIAWLLIVFSGFLISASCERELTCMQIIIGTQCPNLLLNGKLLMNLKYSFCSFNFLSPFPLFRSYLAGRNYASLDEMASPLVASHTSYFSHTYRDVSRWVWFSAKIVVW